MSRDEFIARFLDEFAGQLLDAMIDRQGAERSIWMRQAYLKIKARLGVVYDALKPPGQPEKPAESKPVANGQATHPSGRTDEQRTYSDRGRGRQ